jgi:hypothetical protein
MSIGTLRLADGRTVKGFLVEADAVSGAADISSFGGIISRGAGPSREAGDWPRAK